jgi:hypothetical protein
MHHANGLVVLILLVVGIVLLFRATDRGNGNNGGGK